MSSINSVSWGNTMQAAPKSEAAAKFSNTLHGTEDDTKEKDDDSKTVIERSVVTASDGSQMMILTQVTVSADGKRLGSKVLSKQKISNSDGNDAKIGRAEKPEGTLFEPKTGENSRLAKNVARKEQEYEDYSVTGTFTPGIMLNERT